jgi:hypothetical protein
MESEFTDGFSYQFELKTLAGPGVITVAPTQWDEPGKITIEDYGSSDIHYCISSLFDKHGFGMTGVCMQMGTESPVDINRVLQMYAGKEGEMVLSYDLIGFNPDEMAEGGSVLESAVTFKEKKFTLQDRYQFQGLPISIENKKGSYRTGMYPDGHEWKTFMYFDYGYIRKTKGEDDEGIDVYVGPDRTAKHVYIVKQHKIEAVKKWEGAYCPKCGEHARDCACKEFFDEDKAFVGFGNKEAVISAYGKQYDSPLFIGPISTMTVDDFKKLMTGPKEKVKVPLQFVSESAGDWRSVIRNAETFSSIVAVFKDKMIGPAPEQENTSAEERAINRPILNNFFKGVKLKKAEYKVFEIGEDNKPAYRPVTGWRYGHFATQKVDGKWVTTHIKTGQGVGRVQGKKLDAVEHMWRLEKLGSEWDFDKSEDMPEDLAQHAMEIRDDIENVRLPAELIPAETPAPAPQGSETPLYHGSPVKDLKTIQAGSWYSPVKALAAAFARGRGNKKDPGQIYGVNMDLGGYQWADLTAFGMDEYVTPKQMAVATGVDLAELMQAFQKESTLKDTLEDGLIALRHLVDQKPIMDFYKAKGFDGFKAKEGLKSPTDYIDTYKLFFSQAL